MTPRDAELLWHYLMAVPFLVGGFGLFMYWFTGWLDRRERHHHAAE